MRVSVMAGPVLKDRDPVRYGTQIPIAFFKVIAFVHDETGELCATGYTMSQENFLDASEFVFGEHESRQTRIASIERLTGLSFGPLQRLDPMQGDEVPPVVLRDLDQIPLPGRRALSASRGAGEISRRGTRASAGATSRCRRTRRRTAKAGSTASR